MARNDAKRVLARSLALRSETECWTPWRLVSAIADQVGCSLLQAHRLARDWTLETTREHLADYGGRVSVQQLSLWETGRGRPSERNLDHLCRLYDTRPDRLGYGHDYTDPHQPDEPSTEPSRTDPASVGADVSVVTIDVAPGILPPPALTALGALRRSMTITLESPLSETTLEQWERRTIEYGHAYQIIPPSQLLAASVQDFAEIRLLLERRQSADARARLCRITAQLAGTAGIALVALGEHREARAWFHVAQLAADETGDRTLCAWLLAREAVIPFYFGAPAAALALAERARLLAGSTVCATAAWAPSLEARALARMGRPREAQHALRLAQSAFAQLSAADTADTAYGYTQRQLIWHEGTMWTTLGDTRRAQASLQQARELYAPSEHLDRALIAIDEATCLVRLGEIGVACRETSRLMLALPREHLTGIVVSRVRDLLATVPTRAGGSAVRDLTEILEVARRPAVTAGQ